MAADAARPGRWALLLMVQQRFCSCPRHRSFSRSRRCETRRGWWWSRSRSARWSAGAAAAAAGSRCCGSRSPQWCWRAAPVVHPAYASLERGWAVLLAGAFGLVCETSPATTPFFPRALTALAMSVSIAGMLAAVTPGGLRSSAGAARRRRGTAQRGAGVDARERAVAGMAAVASNGCGTLLDDAVQTADSVVASLPGDAVPYFPALLGLESLAALALCWGLYHRISRTRLGDHSLLSAISASATTWYGDSFPGSCWSFFRFRLRGTSRV